jgi:ATP-dependent helicase/nuclease subunit A
MILRGWLTEQEIRTVDMTGLRWFVRTPLAEKIRSAGNAFRREFSYIAREHPRSIDDTVIAEADDMVLVRGIVDGILPWDDGIEIVDFKTDSADASSVSERAESHRAQMTMYSRAMERIWKRPVRMTHLVFLNAQTVVSRTGAELCATR